MIALVTTTIRKNLRSLLAYLAIAALLVWIYVAIFPSLADQAAEFEKLIQTYPEGFLEAFGVEDAAQTFQSIEGFIATEHYSLMWPLILIIMVVSFGSGAIAGEVDRGTIELLLAQPLSRSRIYWGKLVAGMALIFAFALTSAFSVVPFSLLHNVELQLTNHLTIAVLGSLFGWAILGMTMLLSSFSSSRGRVASLSAGILLLMYAAKIIASLKESLEELKYTSFFHYFDHTNAVINNSIRLENALVFVGAAVVTSLLGWLIFLRRDVAT